MRTETVSIHDLKEGDKVAHYGAILLLSDRKVYAYKTGEYKAVAGNRTEAECVAEFGDTITFHVELVGDNPGSIPMHWLTATEERDRYHLQGNKRMTYARIID